MAIEVGERLPFETRVTVLSEPGDADIDDPIHPVLSRTRTVTLMEYLMGRKVVLITLPGAFTPNSSEKHIPGFLALAEEFHARGIDELICMSVNDAFVLSAWAETLGARGKITFVADGSGDVARDLGMAIDTGRWGGVRMRRSSMLVDDGVVKAFNLEEPGQFTELSGAAFLLSQLK